MTVAEFIEELKKYPEDVEVVMFDGYAPYQVASYWAKAKINYSTTNGGSVQISKKEG